MNTKQPEEQLKEYLYYGLASEILAADTAALVVDEVGKHAEKINGKGYGPFFNSLQDVFWESRILAVAKMFDKPDKRYPTRSIPAILNLIEENS